MRIFRHVDLDGDLIEVLADERAFLSVEVRPLSEQSYIGYLSREAAIRLHNALGEWLYPTGVPVQNPDAAPLTPADIRAMVAGQVAEIMALHQSPQAKYTDAGCTHEGFCKDANGVQSISCPESDPEPHDVGHPEPARQEPDIEGDWRRFGRLLGEIQSRKAMMARGFAQGLAEAVQATRQGVEDAREHPEEDAEGCWVQCPCDRPVARGVECGQCGHVRHRAGGCAARVRREPS